MPSLDPVNLTFQYGCVYNGIPNPEHEPEDYSKAWTLNAYVGFDERADGNGDEVHVGGALF